MNWGKIKALFIYLFIALNAVLLTFYVYTVQKNKTEIVQEKEIIERAMKNDNITVEENTTKRDNLGYVNVTISDLKDIRKEEDSLKYEVENVDKTSTLKVSSENAITNVNKSSYRGELDSFLVEKMKLSANYIFSSYNSSKNEVIYEQQIDGFRIFSNKKARIVFSVENNGDIKNFTLTGVSNIRKDKNETLVSANQAINRLYHEDLIPKNCRVRTTLGYYTYISQTENQVLIPTWNVEISDKDGRISNYYVDAINLNVLNRKGQSL
ncbi:two-component system regulatory protein YycI [Gemella sp.]